MCAFCPFSFKLVRSTVIKLWYLYSPWNSPGQNTGVGSLFPLQGILPTQGSNPGLPHCRWILYQLSHKGSPRILEWVAYPFSSGSSWPRNWTRVSCIAGVFFTNWAIREAHAGWGQTISACTEPFLLQWLLTYAPHWSWGIVGRNEVSIQTDPILGMQWWGPKVFKRRHG